MHTIIGMFTLAQRIENPKLNVRKRKFHEKNRIIWISNSENVKKFRLIATLVLS